MNTSTTKWLIAAAIALLLFIVLFERRTEETSTAPQPLSRLFPDLKPALVSQVEFAQDKLNLRAFRTNDGWLLTAPLAYPALATPIETLATAVSEIRWRTKIPEATWQSQPGGLTNYGLNPPRAVLRVYPGPDRIELRLGSRTAIGNEIYLRIGESPTIHLVDAALLGALPKTVTEWRSPALLDLTGVAFNRVGIRVGPRTLELDRNPTNQTWRLTAPPPAKRADGPRFLQLLQHLQRCPVKEFVTDDPQADLDAFGLLNPESELAFWSGTNRTVAIQFGKSPTNDASLVFARRSSHTNIVTVPREWIDPMRAPNWEFAEHHLLDPLPPAGIDVIEVQGDDRFSLRRVTNDTWRVVEPLNFAADAAIVGDIFQSLARVEAAELAKEIVTDFAPFGLAPPQLRYSLFTTLTNAAGALTNQLFAQLDFGTNTTNRVFVRRHDETSVYSVASVDIESLPRSLFRVRDRRIWEFEGANATAVTITQKGQVRKIARNSERQWANATGPLDVVTNAAIEETLHRLGQLRAEAWFAQGTNRLAALGFGEVAHKVSIEASVAGKTRTQTIEFGRWSPSRRPLASVEFDGQPVIFEFPPRLYIDFVAPYLSIPPTTP